ncbi:hypothetical protein B0T17DRAFT_509867 [Bombardia bombarda]|uniref:Uncharacterized protein n=1 Tax=Bombardia bombarda TaxID=252184 RepID=A0AA40BYM2_9PEZI|nr:hypothetical protein B0T17DRAFT_509867 [Bombardia bombarda]
MINRSIWYGMVHEVPVLRRYSSINPQLVPRSPIQSPAATSATPWRYQAIQARVHCVSATCTLMPLLHLSFVPLPEYIFFVAAMSMMNTAAEQCAWFPQREGPRRTLVQRGSHHAQKGGIRPGRGRTPWRGSDLGTSAFGTEGDQEEGWDTFMSRSHTPPG